MKLSSKVFETILTLCQILLFFSMIITSEDVESWLTDFIDKTIQFIFLLKKSIYIFSEIEDCSLYTLLSTASTFIQQ